MKKNILFINHSVRDGGPGRSLFYLLKHFDYEQFNVFALLPSKDIFSEKLEENGLNVKEIINNNFPENWDSLLREEFNKDVKEIATRSASSTAINAISEKNPNFVGGSADLAASNKTTMNNKKIFQPNTPDGTNLYFGIREHAMGGIISGISLHKG